MWPHETTWGVSALPSGARGDAHSDAREVCGSHVHAHACMQTSSALSPAPPSHLVRMHHHNFLSSSNPWASYILPWGSEPVGLTSHCTATRAPGEVEAEGEAERESEGRG